MADRSLTSHWSVGCKQGGNNVICSRVIGLREQLGVYVLVLYLGDILGDVKTHVNVLTVAPGSLMVQCSYANMQIHMSPTTH